VEIEVISLELGAQLETRRVPFLGIDYDPKSDVLEVIAGDLGHLVRAPRELYVDEDSVNMVSLQIIDADGVRQIVALRDPPMLPDLRHLPR
jgi:hypothetical protein